MISELAFTALVWGCVALVFAVFAYEIYELVLERGLGRD
jgi:hypothetical protein